jgi:P27 family predicted phage terminase small subunit
MPAVRKSDEAHALHGTTPHDRTPVTPSMLVAGRPKYPKNATKEERRFFKQLCNQLEERRALTRGDEYLLTLAVSIWSRWQRAQDALLVQGEICLYERRDSNGAFHKIEKPNLWLKVAEVSEKNLVSILDRLGLTPLAGSKVKQTRPTEKAEEAQPGTVAWMILNGGKDDK